MATIEAQLTNDMKAALKAGDKTRLATIRMAIAAIKNEKVAGDVARDLTEAEEQKVLISEVNKRKDAAEAYTAGHRPELAEKEMAEAAILGEYLPAPLTDADVDAIVAKVIADAESATGEKPSMKQMGQIIKAVNAEVNGRFEGAKVAAKVKAALA